MPTGDPRDNVFVPPIVPPLPMHAAMETTLSGEVRKSRLSKEAITISAIPGEGLAIAAMNMMTAIIEYAMVERKTMDPVLLARKDAVTVSSLERGERFIAYVEGLLPK